MYSRVGLEHFSLTGTPALLLVTDPLVNLQQGAYTHSHLIEPCEPLAEAVSAAEHRCSQEHWAYTPAVGTAHQYLEGLTDSPSMTAVTLVTQYAVLPSRERCSSEEKTWTSPPQLLQSILT